MSEQESFGRLAKQTDFELGLVRDDLEERNPCWLDDYDDFSLYIFDFLAPVNTQVKRGYRVKRSDFQQRDEQIDFAQTFAGVIRSSKSQTLRMLRHSDRIWVHEMTETGHLPDNEDEAISQLGITYDWVGDGNWVADVIEQEIKNIAGAYNFDFMEQIDRSFYLIEEREEQVNSAEDFAIFLATYPMERMSIDWQTVYYDLGLRDPVVSRIMSMVVVTQLNGQKVMFLQGEDLPRRKDNEAVVFDQALQPYLWKLSESLYRRIEYFETKE